MNITLLFLSSLMAVTLSLAQSNAETCVTITSSTECSTFVPFSISKNNELVGLYPFLQHVNDTTTFDAQISTYINTTYVQSKYQTLFGCENINLTNTTDLYARYTTSIICNGIIQNSKNPCNLSAAESRPVCADTCADQALSESIITSDSALCSNPSNDTDTQIRADFTNCALPANSLQNGDCILGSANEPNNCGFGGNTLGLCTYCSRYTDDTCCTSSQADSKCANVAIPSSISTISLPTATSSTKTDQVSETATLSGAAVDSSGKRSSGGLSATNIGLIVVGCVVGVILIGLLMFLACCLRRQHRRQNEEAFGAGHEMKAAESLSDLSSGMLTPSITRASSNYTVLPGGRIARNPSAVKPLVVLQNPIQLDLASEKPLTSPLQDSKYPVLPGNQVARTGVSVEAPPPVALPMANTQSPWSDSPTANYPPEPFSQLELGSITNDSPVPTRPPSTKEIPQEQPVAATRHSPPLSVGGDFGHLVALLEKGGTGKSPASSKHDSTPSLSAADLKEFEVLPDGRLARKYVSSPSIKSSLVSSRMPSPNRESQPPALSQSLASPASSRQSTVVRKSQAPLRSESNNASTPSNAYETLPGGRLVRKKTAMDDQFHNHGLQSTSKLLLSGAIGTGAAAIVSAAKIRQSDERSRRSTRLPKEQEPKSQEAKALGSKDLESKDVKSEHPEPKLQEQTSSTSKVKSDDGLVASEEESSQVTPQPESQPSPASSLSKEENEQETEDASEEYFPVASVPAVPSFRDPHSDSPLTQDEFALERGDMIEIVNIWNDGWATGRVSPDRVDAWEKKHGTLIEADLIETGNGAGLKKEAMSMVKAFPLVCVCAPRYWRKAIRDA
ncbi:hypothetical protein LAWI1_G001871 [Lachnellula willkommii]|uniref:SH3 domain-containing protein n=1 Tax=Lachnellula willkommii TaxID=215461 RepID=A0A559ML90_9HELO|nr:hypothetical protein LAWI1_G001871 [Lachnellula willkommii]